MALPDSLKKLWDVLDGHKTQLGLVLDVLPDVLSNISNVIGLLIPVFTGLHLPAAAAVAVKGIGGIGTVIGLVDKLRKLVTSYLK